MKKTKKELEEKRKLKEEKLKKEERKEKGHYIPQYELDRDTENNLKAVAMKGGNTIIQGFLSKLCFSCQAFQCYP